MQLWENEQKGVVGNFVMNDMDFVEMKRCDYNDLQTLTIKTKTDEQHYLNFTCIYNPARKQNIVNFQIFEKLHEMLINTLGESLSILDSARTGVQNHG